MAKTRGNKPCPAAGYYAYWIHQGRHALTLPPARANDLVRAAIHAAAPDCRPPTADAWLFDGATDLGDALDGLHAIGWLRLRRTLGDDAGVMDPETARYGYWALGVPPHCPGPRWAQACRHVARDAEPLGFGLAPRLATALRAPAVGGPVSPQVSRHGLMTPAIDRIKSIRANPTTTA